MQRQLGALDAPIWGSTGVLLDTLLVRTVLVLAAFLSIGERVWWPVRQPRRRTEPAVPVTID